MPVMDEATIGNWWVHIGAVLCWGVDAAPLCCAMLCWGVDAAPLCCAVLCAVMRILLFTSVLVWLADALCTEEWHLPLPTARRFQAVKEQVAVGVQPTGLLHGERWAQVGALSGQRVCVSVWGTVGGRAACVA